MTGDRQKALKYFTLAVICVSIVAGFISNIYTNYFKDYE